MCSQLKALLFIPVPTWEVAPSTYKNKQTNDHMSISFYIYHSLEDRMRGEGEGSPLNPLTIKVTSI